MRRRLHRKRLRYLAAILAPDRTTRIVDIGASPLHPAPYDLALEAGLVEVTGFEPNPEQYQQLRDTPVPGRTVLPYAVGDGQTGTLNICHTPGFTSMLEPNPDLPRHLGHWGRATTVTDRIEMGTRRLDDIAELTGFDLLKIDIQGGEAAVFRNGRARLADCLVVFSEVAALPIYSGQPLLDAQMAILRAEGFDFHKIMFFKAAPLKGKFCRRLTRAAKTQLVDGDAVFVRDLLHLDRYKDDALKHLAILADTVFHSFDLTVRALEHLHERGAVSEAQVHSYIDMLPDELVVQG